MKMYVKEIYRYALDPTNSIYHSHWWHWDDDNNKFHYCTAKERIVLEKNRERYRLKY